jgi:hypothetical protein
MTTHPLQLTMHWHQSSKRAGGHTKPRSIELKENCCGRKGSPNVPQAEQSFRTAIEIAHRQKGRGWELRATSSLARLLRDTNRREEARSMLADIYNWFTEGFDSADLEDAKALLDELRT